MFRHFGEVGLFDSSGPWSREGGRHAEEVPTGVQTQGLGSDCVREESRRRRRDLRVSDQTIYNWRSQGPDLPRGAPRAEERRAGGASGRPPLVRRARGGVAATKRARRAAERSGAPQEKVGSKPSAAWLRKANPSRSPCRILHVSEPPTDPPWHEFKPPGSTEPGEHQSLR